MTTKELYDLGFRLTLYTSNIDLYETGFESNFPNEKVESIMDDYQYYVDDRLETQYIYDFAETRFNLINLNGNLILRNCNYDDVKRYVENL